MAYLSNEERQRRIIEVVQKHTHVDCPTLLVERIEQGLGRATIFYWCKVEEAGKDEHLQHLDLPEEDAKYIGLNRDNSKYIGLKADST